MQVFGASVIGPMHIQRHLPCQDACAFAVAPSQAVVITVADGLGSASMSEIGANGAVTAAFQYCIEALEAYPIVGRPLGKIVRGAAESARKELERQTAERACDLRDLACTLIVLIAQNDGLACAHIGDGAVVVQRGDGLSLCSGPEESEYANEVVPLTSSNWESSLRVTTTDIAAKGIAVFTDGCQRAAFRRMEGAFVPFEGFFDPIFSFARQVTEHSEGSNEISALLTSSKLNENSDDDKTLVIASIGQE